MPIVSYVSFECISGNKIHEGIFISKTLDLTQPIYTATPSLPYPSPVSHFYHTPAPSNISSLSSSSTATIEGTFIELILRLDRPPRLKIKHFFKLNDESCQQMICLRQVGKIASVPNFFTFLKSVPLPNAADLVLQPIFQVSRDWYTFVIQQAEAQRVLKKRY